MFFIGVFGIQSKQKEIRDINNVVCKKCGGFSSYKLIKSFKYFHIFFIPTFTWGKEYYLKDRSCGAIFLLNKEKGMMLEKGEHIEILDDDLEEIQGSRQTNASYNKMTCRNCLREVDSKYKYCPYCGEELK